MYFESLSQVICVRIQHTSLTKDGGFSTGSTA